MTDPVLRSTYKRADGKPFLEAQPPMLELRGEPSISEMDEARMERHKKALQHFAPIDVVEEQWQLVRFRTIRLGADEKCENPRCVSGMAGRQYYNDKQFAWERCRVCDGSGVKPRDLYPPWKNSVNAERIFFTRFELRVSNYGTPEVFKSLTLDLKLMPDTEKARQECPLPNVDDLPREMQVALLDWLKGGTSGY